MQRFSIWQLISEVAAMKPIANLASMKLRELQEQVEAAAETAGLDPYSKAHLLDSGQRIKE